ncbi:MAG: hypothetical protein NTW62_02135 [Candidatus Nomurabacteria bacterium]|nr:hypothetical protein [Candidatus Nomurabacteria bacterium]
MENKITEEKFIEILHKFFEIVGLQINEISSEDCFCCKWGDQFTKEQKEKIRELGLMDDKENGQKDHLFLGVVGRVHKQSNIFLKQKLELEDGECVSKISRTKDGIVFTITRERTITI